MTGSPRNARNVGNRRQYDWRGEAFWSVTTIIGGGVPKPALINWAKKFTAEVAYDHFSTLAEMHASDDRDGAIDWLKNAAFRMRDKAADLGSVVHASCEAVALGKPIPPWPKSAEPRMEGFKSFLIDCAPDFHNVEASVYNRPEHYAGTLDAICTINGRRYLLDTKTGKGVYPEVGLQLAAYRFAEFIGLPDGSEAPMPEVDACAVLHLPEAGGYELVDVRADAEIFLAFKFVREVFFWQTQTSKSVILGPLEAMSATAEATRPLADALAAKGK
jgi:hypothetical protein